MSLVLESLGIAFQDNRILVEAYKTYGKMILLDSKSIQNGKGLFINLDKLSETFKDAFIKWVIYINKDNIEIGKKPFINLQIALKCPIWKVIKIPFETIELDTQSLGKLKPTIKTINSKPTIKNIK